MKGIQSFSVLVLSMLMISVSMICISTLGTASSSDEVEVKLSLINNDAAAEVIGYSGTGSIAIIPSVYQGVPVVSIASFAFEGSDTLRSVVIPGSVTRIGTYAFNGCIYLSSLTIEHGVTTIESNAFSGCNSLKTVVIPDSVTTIKDWAFERCGSLTSVTLGSGVDYIGVGVFFSCTSLSSITFLGLTAPDVVGSNWIGITSSQLRGHAYAASNFPAKGDDWNSLIMGENIPGTVDSNGKVPDPPTDLSVSTGNGYNYVNWSAPAMDGGYSITAYKVYRTTGSGSTSVVGLSDSNSYTDLSVENGVQYAYSVSAINAIGESNRSGTVKIVASFNISVPTYPEKMTVTLVDGKVTLNWSAPSQNGGASVINYKIYRGEQRDNLTLIATSSVLHYVDNSAVNYKYYFYAVSAVNSIGEGGKSNSIGIEVDPQDAITKANQERQQFMLIVTIAIILTILAIEMFGLIRWGLSELTAGAISGVIGSFFIPFGIGIGLSLTNLTNYYLAAIGSIAMVLGIPFSYVIHRYYQRDELQRNVSILKWLRRGRVKNRP